MEDLNKLNPKKVRKYQNNVESYLEKLRVGTGSNIKYTHISMGDHFTGKFMLDKKQIKEFNKIYAEAIDYGVIFNIAEKPKDYGPLIIDIDLEIPIEDYKEDLRLYNNDMILKVIDTYREVSKEYLDLDSNELVASFFEKEKPTKKISTVKDGFHIIFHGITAHYKLRYLIRDHVVKKLTDDKLFQGFIKPVNDIIDKAVVHVNSWLLSGSKKKDGQLYKLKIIYDENNKLIDITNTLTDKYKIVKMYSLNDKLRSEKDSTIYLEETNFEDIESEYSKIGEKQYNVKNAPEHVVSENKEDTIRKAIYLVSLLSDDRNDSFDSWIRIGWALHNIDFSLLNIWIEFSKKSKKFKEGECESKWYAMREEGLTIRSLMYWAEEDNYQKYHEFIKLEFNEILNKSLDGSTYFVAKALYTKYMEKFICASIKANLWYEFRNNRWYPIHDGYTLKKEISESFVNEYLQLVSKYSLKAIKLSGVEKDEIQQKAVKTQSIVKKLMDISFKEKIMKEATILFYDPDFEKKLNENYDILGFTNGVYDLANSEFREGRPDDYISISTNVDYYPFVESNPFAQKMLKFFREILPNEEVRKYLLLSLATCVAGHNREEKCRIVTGSGSNGKSLLFSLVQQALGDYYISCPITIITRKRNSSNQASPELLRLKGVRCGCFQETDDGEKLNVGILKEITGNDSFMVRGLYSDPIEIKPQVKFFLACNQLPEVPSTDGGTWRRLRVVDFKSKFTENPVKPNEFMIDNTLKQRIKDWAPLFASYMVHLYVTDYKHLPYLNEPDEVKYSTENYKAENDHYTEFFINRIVYTGNRSDSILVKSAYDDFKAWYKGSRDAGRTPPQIDLNKFLYEKIGEPKNNKWRGYRFNNAENNAVSDSDDDNGDALDC
jgi:P4 family phage/plasmid primase-like protien